MIRIRGVMLLTLGFGLGYVKALHDVPAIEDGLVTVIELLKDAAKERANKDNEQQGETP